MKSIVFAILAIALLIPAGLVSAQNPSTAVENDPNTNPAANACFAGGSMAGKCSTTDLDGDDQVEDWEVFYMYTAGWYIIRLDWGIYTRDQVPQLYRWLLPAVPVVIDPVTGQVIELEPEELTCTLQLKGFTNNVIVTVPLSLITDGVNFNGTPDTPYVFYWASPGLLYVSPADLSGAYNLYHPSIGWTDFGTPITCPTTIPPVFP